MAINNLGESTASGISEVVNSGSELAKSGASSARNSIKYTGGKLYEGGAMVGGTVKGKLDDTGITEKAKYAGSKLYEGGAAAGSTVKGKLDETGVTEKAAYVGTAVVTNVKYAGGVVNEKIEANPTLANAKAATT